MILASFEAAWAAARECLTPPFRATLWKVLALTLAVLAAVWYALDTVLVGLIAAAPYPWLQTTLSIVTGVGLVFALAFVVAPVSMLVAGFFVDDLAELVERDSRDTPVGHPLPAGTAVWLAAKFAAVSLLVNLCALAVFLVPGVNAIVFFVANAYLFGREYFELAALRYHPIEEVRRLRREHAVELFFAGLFIAAIVAIPVVNLLTPLFGTAFMVRLHRLMGLVPPLRVTRDDIRIDYASR